MIANVVIVGNLLESTPEGLHLSDKWRRQDETWRREHPEAAALMDDIQEDLDAVVLYGVDHG